jgi:hypothetical protein
MDHSEHEKSAVKTWFLIMLMVGWVAFKGWLAYTVIGDLGQPDWDYRPIMDVPGESPYAVSTPYHALPYAQHVQGELGKEENPLHLKVIPLKGLE